MTDNADLKLFVEPQSVAVIGASLRAGPGSFNIVERMLAYGYRGELYPVNPRGGAILDIPVFRSVEEINASVDLAVVCTPRIAVPNVVRQCVDKGIRAIVIITQGFSDAGDEAGRQLHREIVDAVRGTCTRVVGPNTIGIVNNFINFTTSFVDFDTVTAGVGIICQSGVLLNASQDLCGGIGIGIDIGNTSDVGFVEFMDYLGQDPRIKVINLHMEGLRDGRRFMQAARKVTACKPVLALKTGRSEEGARAAGSHSGSLAGEDAVYSAAFAQSGIIRVENSARLADLNRTLLTYREMRGRRVGFITISGGAGIMALDACGKYGLEPACFSSETRAALSEVFPEWMKVSNPADIWPAAMAGGYREIASLALDRILADEGVDAVLCLVTAYLDPDEDPMNISDLINEIAARYPHKPTAVWMFGPHRPRYAQKFSDAGKVVVYRSPDDALYCLAELYHYHNEIKGRQYDDFSPPQNIDRSRAGNILAAARSAGLLTLNEQALDIMECYGIPVVRRGLAKSRKEALCMADKLGYPVVMKIASPDITHKSDIGGVRLDIYSVEELGRAYDEIMEGVRISAPGARIDGVLLQSRIFGGTEVILGGKRDPQFGPVLVYGLGGVFTELIHDVTFRVAPVTFREAREMIRETKSFRILSGARGKELGDIDALAMCIVRLGTLLYEQPQIIEVDINPLLVMPEGCLALDARIITNEVLFSARSASG